MSCAIYPSTDIITCLLSTCSSAVPPRSRELLRGTALSFLLTAAPPASGAGLSQSRLAGWKAGWLAEGSTVTGSTEEGGESARLCLATSQGRQWWPGCSVAWPARQQLPGTNMACFVRGHKCLIYRGERIPDVWRTHLPLRLVKGAPEMKALTVPPMRLLQLPEPPARPLGQPCPPPPCGTPALPGLSTLLRAPRVSCS